MHEHMLLSIFLVTIKLIVLSDTKDCGYAIAITPNPTFYEGM